jgi:GT2 family glycosyltransferase
MEVVPPGPYAQTCNILYPRRLLEEVGGFDESAPLSSGEDTDLALRARATGADYIGAAGALVYHAVETHSLLSMVRFARRWESLAFVVKRHPQLRRELVYGIFWKRAHVWLPLAVAGVLAAPRRPLTLVLVLPYAKVAMPHRGSHVRGRLRALAELTGRAVLDIAEMAVLVRGSLRYRTLFL